MFKKKKKVVKERPYPLNKSLLQMSMQNSKHFIEVNTRQKSR